MKYEVGDIIEYNKEHFYVLGINKDNVLFPYRLKLLTGYKAGYISNWSKAIEDESELVKGNNYVN